MYRRHVFVFTQMFWWTTLLYTLPITKKELLSVSDIVLVYINDGVYGELEKIRGSVPKPTQGIDPNVPSTSSVTLGNNTPVAAKQNSNVNTGNDLININAGIIGNTSAEMGTQLDKDVTPQSVSKPPSRCDIIPNLSTEVAPNKTQTGSVIPENTATKDDGHPPNQSSKATTDTGRTKATLPGIEVFLSKTCTIPLVRCDFDIIKRTVKTRKEQNKEGKMGKDNSNLEADNPTNAAPESTTTTLRTSTRKRTVIDYKKFLEEFADIPPSPPKRRKEVDLKRKPSRSRIAAEKYRKSGFSTKPTNTPKPVCHRRSADMPQQTPIPSTSTAMETDVSVAQQTPIPSTSTAVETDVSVPHKTITTPATTHETQDAIDALLLLSTAGT